VRSLIRHLAAAGVVPALAAMAGNADALPMLADYCMEKEIVGMQSLKVGEGYLIFTLAFHYIGRVVSVTLTDVVLEDAGCVFETGDLTLAISKGKLTNVELLPRGWIQSTEAIIGASPWPHKLPYKP
jgi:hypothetical protein